MLFGSRRYRAGMTGLLLAGVLACSRAPAPTAEPHWFRIERGASAREVAKALEREGLVANRWTFLVWFRFPSRHAGRIRPGVYPLSGRETGWQLSRIFRQGPPAAKVTFPEGWTGKQMAAQLESRNIVSAEAFTRTVEKDRLEGYLFPDTYVFDQTSDTATVVQAMTHRFREKLPSDWKGQLKTLNLSEAQAVTLASIVEREARVPSERPIIAGVFLNRLHKHWRLESCATVEYALGAWKPRLRYKDLEVDSPYNTYRHAGLPPGPIGNPGAAALYAASHPAVTDMMFFVAAGDGTHRFSRYYQEHLAAQKKRHGR